MKPSQPKQGEPIRIVQTAKGPRYRVVIDVAPKGAPRKQVTRTLDSLKEARQFVNETRDRVAKGNYTAPSRVTLRTLSEDWLRSRRDIREVSVNGYRSVLNPVLDRIGDRPAQSLTRPELDLLMEQLEADGGRRGKPLSQRTLVYTLGAFRQVLDYGVSAGVLSANPAADVRVRRRRKGDRSTVTVWSTEELRAFLRHLDTESDVWVRAAFRLTACGLRRSEVLGLVWDAVDLERGTIRVEASRVKTGRGYATERDDAKSAARVRDVPVESIQPGTMAALRALRAAQAAARLTAGTAYENAGLVVVDGIGRGIHPDVYSLRWRGLCKEAGLVPIKLHAVRHSLATALHDAGVAPAHAAAMLGHTVATHLSYYVTRTDTGIAQAADTLRGLLAADA